MRSRLVMLAIAAIAGIGCYHPPPGSPLEAAVNFRSTVFDLIGKDEAATARLNALRVGMSEQEVIAQAGSPSKRETRAGDDRRASETWTYEGELSTLAVLTFEDGKLAAVQTDPDRPTTD